MNIINLINEELLNLKEEIIVKSSIPNTMSFYHGGNLDRYDDNLIQRKGRFEYGAGLYLTTHYETAKKYARGEDMMVLFNMNKIVDTKIIKPTDNIKDYLIIN